MSPGLAPDMLVRTTRRRWFIRFLAGALSIVVGASTQDGILHAQTSQSTWVPESFALLPLGGLVDQFDRAYDLAQVRGRPVVVLVADREGSDGQRLWLASLRASLPASAVVVAAADLVGAPRLLRGVIRKGFPKDTTVRILMDWDGRVARRVRGERDHLVALVFGPDGGIRERFVLPASAVDAGVRGRVVAAAAP